MRRSDTMGASSEIMVPRGSQQQSVRPGFVRLTCLVLGMSLLVTGFAENTRAELNAVQNMQGGTPRQSQVQINVLSLFHPLEFVVSPRNASLSILVGDQRMTLMAGEHARVRRKDSSHVLVDAGSSAETLQAGAFEVTSNAAEAPDFLLEAPGKLRREYQGTLRMQAVGPVLEAVVTMPLETAVASVVAAESWPDRSGSTLEAMKAQAVASRSFLVARSSGHKGFDFCDTTHCQFLKAPPGTGSMADLAARATKGLVLGWHDAQLQEDAVLAAMYARSCGGQSRTLREIGLPGKGYPYYAVRCAYCSRHPELWQRSVDESQASKFSEADRLAFNRVHGWSAIPSIGGKPDGHGLLVGRGDGHGLGLCQLGAAEMARHGASYREILAHYYPNTHVVEWQHLQH
jgi:hypothetical protein